MNIEDKKLKMNIWQWMRSLASSLYIGVIGLAFLIFILLSQSSAYAQGVTVPAGSKLNVNAGTLNVPGNITNAGTLQTSTGTITTTGSWVNSGTFTPGTGLVNFIAGVGVTQDLTSGGTGAGKLFYKLTHSGAGTVRLLTNAIEISNNFVNSAGIFNANALTMTVSGNWNNTATFTHGNNTVDLGTGSNSILGTTTFYNLQKTVSSAQQLTFEQVNTQTVTHSLTLKGAAGNILTIESTVPGAGGTKGKLTLNAGGVQDLDYLSVANNDASGGLTMIARHSSELFAGTTINWNFGTPTITWQGDDGTTPTNWDTATNWDVGVVPTAGDIVIIPNGAPAYPTLAAIAGAGISVGNLTIGSAATLTLAGKNFTITDTLTNNGTINLVGSETVAITTHDTTVGTFNYQGDNDGAQDTYTGKLLAAYFNLTFNDTNGADIFRSNGNIAVAGALTVTNGTLDISTNGNTLTTTGTLSVNGANGVLTATTGNIDANGAVSISNGVFTAPNATKSFTVAGNFAHSGGTFTHSSGTVTLDGTSQTLSGTTTFYGLYKVTANGTLTFTVGAGNTQTIAAGGSLILQGTSGNNMSINSTSAGTKGSLVLTAGATQSVKYVTVRDNDATGGLTIVARSSTESPASSTTNWSFGAATMTWQGDDGTTPTNWDTATNWDLGIVPLDEDTAIIPDVANDPILATNVQVENLTVASGAIVTLNGKNLTVDTAFNNNTGTIRARGDETISLTQDTDSGTFEYVGDNDGVQDTYSGKLFATYYHLTFNDTNGADIFRTTASLAASGNTTISAGVLDISTNTNTLTTTGTLTVGGATAVLTATNGNIDANSSVSITSGTLTAPTTAKSFTVAGNFAHTGGTFTHSSGTVTLDTAATATISGDTTFYNLTSTTAGKTIQFTTATTQTINNTFTITGTSASKITLSKTAAAGDWNIAFPNGAQSILYASVSDSEVTGVNNDITCINCTNGGGNDNADAAATPQWIFLNVAINVPATGNQTIDTLPTIIGTADAGSVVTIKDIGGNTVATATADANGNWRVEATVAMSVGANSLTPYVGGAPGSSVAVTVSASPSTDDVPTITSPAVNERISDPTPTIIGRGLANSTVTIVANDASGNLLLQTVGSGTTNASGNYSIDLTTALTKGVTYLSVTVDGVASNILAVRLTDPFGVVFDSVSGNPIENATVTFYRAATGVAAVPGVDLDAADVNPVVTGADGFYSFIAADGNYYMTVTAGNYSYPSVETSFPAGRTVTTGSKGETITVAGIILEIDHPMDSDAQILRITKDANKKEARIGDVVTYTVTIENRSTTSVASVYLEDNIPPGFKFVEGRVILDNVPIGNPIGNRPVKFNIGTVAAGATKVLKYQLVIGAGVTVGSYENTAVATYLTGQRLSNNASAVVKVVLDPTFDLGSVLGKVFFDLNENGRQDAPEYVYLDRDTIKENPVPNVRIVMEDGTVIQTDKNGLFNIPGLIPGRHLFRVDESTLPEGSYLTTDKVVVVDITPGSLSKVNFGVNMDYDRFKNVDQRFFTEKVNISHDKDRPTPRMNVSLFGDEIIVHNDIFAQKPEFRIFNNYTAFVEYWKLDIIDTDTKAVVRTFQGDRLNISDPILWDGIDNKGEPIHLDRQYAYVAYVESKDGKYDETKPKSINFRTIKDDEELAKYFADQKLKQDDHLKWLIAQSKENSLSVQNILVSGETIKVDRLNANLQSIRIMKAGELFTEIPIVEKRGLTPRELIEGNDSIGASEQVTLDVILPKGDYDFVIQETVKGKDNLADAEHASVVPLPGVLTEKSLENDQGVSIPVQQYVKAVRVGEDYMFFVAMGDAKAGYTFNTGNIEPVQQDDKFKNGFWTEGKFAYYLKGKVLGKYLITSSFDSDRERKELFKSLDPDQYYPVYGDASQKNYQATDTQGNLYLLLEWDKSSAIWGNYAISFTDTEFAQFSRTLYGGKIDYQSVATTQYGDPRTRVIVFNARSKQRSAHNEFLATGGSLYYLKNKDVIEGSDKVRIEVRDRITGLVISSRDMKLNADYEMDNANGRMTFWRPVPFIVESYAITSSELLRGNLVYVVVDYEYDVRDEVEEGSTGGRVKQALTNNVIVGGTFVREGQASQNYELMGTDLTLRLGPATITTEYAESSAEALGTYVSTDGGLTFSQLSTANNAQGRAYGIKGDASLFNRLGTSAYYKWIDNDFSTGSTTAQQGKELKGLGLTFDVTKDTRATVRYDVQTLLDNGNLQTQAQVGATKTATTLMQIVHQLRDLTLTGEYRKQEVSDKKDQFNSETNKEEDLMALRADYKLSDKLTISLAQQKTLKGANNDQTTFGLTAKPDENLTIKAQETIGQSGTATTLGVEANMNKDLTLSAEQSVTRDNAGQVGSITSVGASAKVDDQTSIQTSMGVSEMSPTNKSTTFAFGGTSQVDKDTQNESRVAVTNSSVDGKDVTYTFGTKKRLSDELEMASTRTFGLNKGKQLTDSTYSLIREKDGHKLEGSLSRQYTQDPQEISRSNIFGLTGDINDKWALSGALTRGEVQNLNATTTTRNALSVAIGYVNKDAETGEQILKSSTKLEIRLDSSDQNHRQLVFSNATEGKVTPELTIFNKLEFSNTVNTTTSTVEAAYKEMMIGGAYRPIEFDRLNLLARYTYLENKGPNGQIDSADIEKEITQVLAGEAIYDIDEKWQLAEKYAYRTTQEKVTGFDFTQTHTWLMIHRLNYKINNDWLVGGEFRILTQEEAKDSKRGFLIEAARRLGEHAQLGVGYNFTDFNDDLTALSYTAQGPFVRLTGKFYDQTPEEIERAKAKWLEEKINHWAWAIIQDEISHENSAVLQELNQYFFLAKKANERGDLEESRQIYKDILVAGQMMLDEASEYIRGRINTEKNLKDMKTMADQYIKNGQYEKAKKILEKILEELHFGMLE